MFKDVKLKAWKFIFFKNEKLRVIINSQDQEYHF